MRIQLLILLLFSFFWGCECVPDINTPKVIDPEESAKVAFINMSGQFKDLSITTNNIEINKNLKYQDMITIYKNVPSGIAFLKVTDNNTSSSVLSFSLELEIDNYYTLYIFDNNSRIEVLLVSDPDPDTNYLRFINLTELNDKNIRFEIENNTDFTKTLSNKEYSDPITISSGIKTIYIYDDKNGSLIDSIEKNIEGTNSIIAFGINLNSIQLFPIQHKVE